MKTALRRAVLAGAVLPWGCADLALEADWTPAELVFFPDRAAVGIGESVRLPVFVKDREGDVMRVPGWAPPGWRVSDETAAAVSRDGTLTGMKAGKVVLTARLDELTADACIDVDPDPLVMKAPVIYLTQAAQNRENTTRLIAGRRALLRVFVVGDRPRLFGPAVQVTLLHDDSVVFEKLVRPSAEWIPDGVDQSVLHGSFNVEIPGSVIQPGVRMMVRLDPECVVPVALGSRTRYPPLESTELLVVEPPLFRQIFVPTLSWPTGDYTVFDWLDEIGPGSEQMRYTRNLLPVSEMEVEVRSTFTTGADLTTGRGWDRWLNEIGVLHMKEGRRGYYYGVVGSSPGSIVGTAGVGVPWSVGLDSAVVYTHETGHSMSLGHAPCGSASRPDPDYPYARGSIGIWGYDVETGKLHDPARYRDIMGYCFGRVWISDYHFDRATTHRLDGDGGVDLWGGADTGGGKRLVVWGLVRDGELTLDPAVCPGRTGRASREGRSLPGRGARCRWGNRILPLLLADSAGAWRRQLRLLRPLRPRVGREARPCGAHRAGGRVHHEPRRWARDRGVDGSGHGIDPGHRPGLGRRSAARRGDSGRDDNPGDSGGRVAVAVRLPR